MNAIQCQNCGAENAATVHFCKQCGSKLERARVTAVIGQPASNLLITMMLPALVRDEIGYQSNWS